MLAARWSKRNNNFKQITESAQFSIINITFNLTFLKKLLLFVIFASKNVGASVGGVCCRLIRRVTKNVVCANMQVEASGVEGTRAEDLKSSL